MAKPEPAPITTSMANSLRGLHRMAEAIVPGDGLFEMIDRQFHA
jgi:hypothetical protein